MDERRHTFREDVDRDGVDVAARGGVLARVRPAVGRRHVLDDKQTRLDIRVRVDRLVHVRPPLVGVGPLPVHEPLHLSTDHCFTSGHMSYE